VSDKKKDEGVDLNDAARRSTEILSSILDAIPPGTPMDEVLAATIVMAHESCFTMNEAIEAVKIHWDMG
jgi:hypothetical protein